MILRGHCSKALQGHLVWDIGGTILLIQTLMSGNLQQSLISLALILPAVVLCLVIHELSHGLMAYLFGDRTAKNAGRLTFDPLAHLDPVGFVCLLLLGFGWARPVPVNISNFKHKRLGMAMTALAGPLSNIVLAVVAFMVYIALYAQHLADSNTFAQAISMFISYVAQLSVGLGIFNLIPVYPMDGSRILQAILPFRMQAKWNAFFQKYQSIVVLILVVLVWFGGLHVVISLGTNAVYQLSLTIYSTLFLG